MERGEERREQERFDDSYTIHVNWETETRGIEPKNGKDEEESVEAQFTLSKNESSGDEVEGQTVTVEMNLKLHFPGEFGGGDEAKDRRRWWRWGWRKKNVVLWKDEKQKKEAKRLVNKFVGTTLCGVKRDDAAN